MNRALIAACAAAMAVTAAVLAAPQEPPPEAPAGFAVAEMQAVRERLEPRGLALSEHTMISDHTRDRYCPYADAGAQKGAEHCATSAIVDSGSTIGNFNVGAGPAMAVAIVDSPAGGQGRAGEIFGAVIESLVCECWAEREPGGFATVWEWMAEAQRPLDGSDGSRPLQSRISGLEQRELLLEVARDGGGYLWTLSIT